MTGPDLLWKTADGRMIKIKDMDDGHLLNSVRLLFLRKADAHPAAPGAEVRTRFLWQVRWQPLLDAMTAECARRGLDTSNLTPDRVKVLVAKRRLATAPAGPKSPPYEPPKRLIGKEE